MRGIEEGSNAKETYEQKKKEEEQKKQKEKEKEDKFINELKENVTKIYTEFNKSMDELLKVEGGIKYHWSYNLYDKDSQNLINILEKLKILNGRLKKMESVRG